MPVRASVYAAFFLVMMPLQSVWMSPALAAIPDSDNPQAHLEKHFRADFHEYNKRTMSGAYLEVGEQDPKWDALAVEYLNGQADSFTNQKATDKTRVPESVSDRRMKELTRQLVDRRVRRRRADASVSF